MERYNSQELFKEIGKAGQEKISKAAITIVGCGALGSNCAEILARAGVKKIRIIDFDKVELNNLQRQTLFEEEDVGKLKVYALAAHLKKINSDVQIEVFKEKLTKENTDLLRGDLIIDGTDNFETRFILNKYAKKNDVLFVFGSCVNSKGMVYPVYKGPCFECIFLNSKDFESCQNQGILASAAKITSALQCSFALRFLSQKKLKSELIKFDVWSGDFIKFKVKKNPKCTCCLDIEEKEEFIIKECLTKAMYKSSLKKKARLKMKKLNVFEIVEDGGIICVIKVDGEEIIVHEYGELIFKSLKNVEKIKKISKKIYEAAL